ncbi:hypothetical protein N7462_011035 [Penicillium macrosclerotiorum]|uniref:uncharacterized protein n=1 Tax=Penicillium macrosclerotiorum TaxID=303699 RepID=UPI0025478C7A|nr:uncharacterized protein N7462_011035 [Penicillium macrosclerotiorum]KAJ5666626.1 hypothetical protein N7462_011035 [Penicillium macrosclerotiorum]
MAYQIEPAVEADAPALAHINVVSFQGRGLLNQVFPEATESMLEAYKSVYTMKHFSNPQIHVLKVVDSMTQEVIGYGRWLVPASLGLLPSAPVLSEQAQEVAKDPLRLAPRPMNEALYMKFRGMLETSRQKHARESDITLDLLATLPTHQGRGIGSALLRWGTAKADQWQVRIYLEATGEGYPLYIKHGWRPVEEIQLDRTQFGAAGQETFWIMIRDPIPPSQ